MTDTYTITPSDLDDLFPYGCLVVTDAQTGLSKAIGTDNYGQVKSVFLGVDLCTGCDAPVDGVCVACTVPLTDVEHLGSGRIAA